MHEYSGQSVSSKYYNVIDILENMKIKMRMNVLIGDK